MDDTFDPSTSALLVFDLLNGHVKKDDEATRARMAPVITNAERLVSAARAANMMIAYAAANHRSDGGTTVRTRRDLNNRLQPLDSSSSGEPLLSGGAWETQVIDEIAPRDEDFIVPKYRWSAFYQTYLELALRAQRIATLVLIGGSTDVGVASTAYGARDRDINVVIPSDACTSPERDNHDQFMTRIFPRMARVRTTEQVCAMITGGAAGGR